MRALQEQDFDKMASRVVDRFMGGSKLADAATEEAMGGQLGPDQIERLVQAANTMAFLRLMEQQKQHAMAGQGQGAPQGPDMTHEFDPIDARQIIQQIVGQVDVPHMDAPPAAPEMGGMGDHGPLPNEHEAPEHDDAAPPMDADDDGPFPKGEKQKAKDKESGKEKKAPPEAKKDEAKEAAFRSRRQRKLADVLEDQYKQAEWAFEETLTDLTRQLKVAHGAPTLEQFEKDALALDASQIGVVVQNVVREARGWPALSHDAAWTKAAAIADRHLVTETKVTRAFERLVKIAAEAERLQTAFTYLRSQCA